MVYIAIVALLIIFSAPAHAYVDPGSGSYMLQIAMAGLLAAAFSLKMCWQRLREFVAGCFSSQVRSEVRRRA